MRIAVIGCGHVGLVTGACLASIGHHVIFADRDAQLMCLLKEGNLPLYEPNLDKLFQRGYADEAVSFAFHSVEAVEEADVVFLCVGVPQLESGESDLSAMDTAVRQIAQAKGKPKLIVVRSTMPVETGRQLKHLLRVYSRDCQTCFKVAANPQFLRAGTAVNDFLHPDRILMGVEDSEVETTLRQIYRPILEQRFRCLIHGEGCPPRSAPEVLVTSVRSAELIKHTSNAFLALKISYANVLADLCERLGADVQEVTHAVGLDSRIGSAFLKAGIGFGGSRLPKDLSAFCRLTKRAGLEAGILEGAEQVNRNRIAIFLGKVQRYLWVLKDKRIGVLGLAHKANTDDIRSSPAIDLCKCFLAAGAQVRAYDPRAMMQTRAAFPDILCTADAYGVAERADALVVATDWGEFLNLDWKRIRDIMARPAVFDGRNLLNPFQMRALGFEYESVGRPVC